MENDEGLWSYVARVWLDHGITPYTGAVENKTPGIFELYAISYFFFGLDVFFVRFLGILAILGNMFLLFRIGKQLRSRLAGVLAMYVFGLTATWNLLNGMAASYTETFMCFFITLSFYFLIHPFKNIRSHWLLLLSGIAMGLAITFKQIAIVSIFPLLFFVLVVFYRDKALKTKLWSLCMIGFGIGTAIVVTMIPLFFYGVTMGDYVDGAWLILLNSGSRSSLVDRMYGFMNTWFESRIVIFYFVFLLIAIFPKFLKKPYFIGLLVWMFFDFLGVNASGNLFGHHIKQLMPSLALITGILLDKVVVVMKVDESYKKMSRFIMVLIMILFPYQELVINGYVKGYPDPEKEIALWMKAHTTEQDFVFGYGDLVGSVMAYSERLSPSKFYNATFVQSAQDWAIFMADMKRNPPKFIVADTRKTKYLMNEEIKADYTFYGCKFGYDIYIHSSRVADLKLLEPVISE